MEESIFSKCHCCCSAVEVDVDDGDWYNKISSNELPFFNVSLWRNGFTRPLGWKERLRWCARILRTGNPWADHTMLTSQDARKVAEFILEKLDKYAKTKKEGTE